MISKLKHLLNDDGMKARTFRGTLLTGVSFGTQNLVRLGGNLILTRILFPEAFGLMALVYVVLSAARTFSDVGLNVVVIQDKDGDDPLFLNTAWVLQIIRGLLLAIIISLCAGPIAVFYEQPELAPILIVIGLSSIIQGLNSTRIALARRELKLGRITALELVTQLIGLGATIAFALYLQSVWALVIGYLIGTSTLAILSHLMLPGPRNRLAFHKPYVGRMLRFGGFIFIASAGTFLLTQGDRVILGKLVTLEELALYTIAFFLATVPILLAQMLSGKIVFPLYSRRSPWENESNRQNIFKMRRILTSVTFCGLVFFALIGDPLVQLLYDPRYQGAGPLVAFLALAHFPQSVMTDHKQIAMAAGHSGKYAFITMMLACAQLGAMLFFGSLFGLNGVVLGLGIAPLIVYPALVWLILPYRGWDVWHDLGFGLLFAAFIGFEYTRGMFDFLWDSGVM